MKNSEIKKQLSEYNEILRKLKNKKRVCYHSGCEKEAINSHILQKNGILRNISDNNHLYTLSSENVLVTDSVIIKKIGINDALTFKGFCQKHDTDIFKEIENGGTLNLYDYRTQLLLSYRGVLNELRKKEIAKEWAVEIKKLIPRFNRDSNEKLELYINSVELGIRDIENYKSTLEINLLNSNKDFRFIVLEYPKIEICTSSFYSKGSLDDLWNDYITNTYNLIPAVIVNLIPTSTNLMLIIGYLKEFEQSLEKYVETFKILDYNEQLKRLSDYLLLNIETWVCSPNLYQYLLKKNEKQIVHIFSSSSICNDSEITTDFNMFQDLIQKHPK